MRIASVRLAALLLATTAGAAAPGCGGGGGGGGPCALPGTLLAVALEGATAPGTGGGTFGPIPATVDVAVANAGWSAFWADVSAGTTSKGLFAAQPDGTVVLVFSVGEAVPAPGTGTISDFLRVFVTEGGVVVALVATTGGTGGGFLSARVDGSGGVVEKDGVLFFGDTLPATPLHAAPGTWTAVDDEQIRVDDQGSLFFVGTGSTGGTPPNGVWRVDRDGSDLIALALTGDAAGGFPGGSTYGLEFEGLSIDEDGVLIGYGVNVLPGGTGALYATNGTTSSLVAKDGDVAPGTGGLRTYEDVVSGVVAVNLSGLGVGFVFWQSDLSGGAPDDGIFFRQVAPSLGSQTAMAVSGDDAPGAGTSAVFSTLRLLEPQNDPPVLTMLADITSGDTGRVMYSIPAPGSFEEVLREGESPPGSVGGAEFTLLFPSLSVPRTHVTDDRGSPAVSAVLSDGSTGVWWAIRLCNLFAVAVEGDPAPGTAGTFAPFVAPSTVTTARGILVFRAAITGGANPSGLFRQF
jgi:hypothetical protein